MIRHFRLLLLLLVLDAFLLELVVRGRVVAIDHGAGTGWLVRVVLLLLLLPHSVISGALGFRVTVAPCVIQRRIGTARSVARR